MAHVAVKRSTEIVGVAQYRRDGLVPYQPPASHQLKLRCRLPQGAPGMAQEQELLGRWAVMPFRDVRWNRDG
jgi:hypothetical protein